MKKILIISFILLFSLSFIACPKTNVDAGDSGDAGDVSEGPGILELDTIINTNIPIANKGITANEDGSKIYIWGYYEDKLYIWNGETLSSLSNNLVVDVFSDLTLDAEGNIYISKGGTGPTNNYLKKWSIETGSNMWGSNGISVTSGVLRGLDKAEIDGTEYIYVADANSKIHKLDKSDGTVLDSISVNDYPLDVAVDSDENYYVLSSVIIFPYVQGDSITLRKYDSSGTQIGDDVTLEAGSFYLTLGSDNFLYISSTTFDSLTRKIFSYDSDLNFVKETLISSEYEGFSGGIDTYGTGSDKRIIIAVQKGVTIPTRLSDVFVFKDTYYNTAIE